MHEMSICQALITEIEAVARDQGARRVVSVLVRAGPLSGVEPQLLEFAFSIAREGTVASDAQLAIESMPVRVHCESCGIQSAAAANRLVCEQCGDWHVRVVSGDELLLMSVELERNSPE